MSEFKNRITELVERINASPKILAAIKEWIDGYNGKTIAFKMPEETLYITFGKDGVNLVEGEPASFDLMLLADEETLMDGVFKDPTRMRQYLKDGTVVIWGNLHELLKFSEIVILSLQ
ncbi:MAG: SCP2 sterol-binding domain-containing protein [Candidatus Lokiarchaeia archaeon]